MPTHQDLAHDFPEMKDAIHALKTSDNHFKRLFDEYEAVSKELHRDGETMCDERAEDCKKRRLELKDELYKMMKEHSGKKSCCG
jgi:uncharacterized protein YdcH (DUF465 family)